MLFHSPTFIIFLLIFIAGLSWVKRDGKIIYACIMSYIFYGWWYPPYVLILFLLTLYAHFFAKYKLPSRTSRGVVVALGLLPLIVFKYSDFVFTNLNNFLGIPVPFMADWALPIGISFITFTAIAFVLDSQRNQAPASQNLWHTGLFLSFFPQLIAGPILRASELMPQLTRIKLNLFEIKFALLLFSFGALKKVGIADQIAPYVDSIYSNTNAISPGDAWLVLYAFSIQIYGDFSGYTDMALALAALCGVSLPENFNRPYLASSIREFWTRWHMTLSRWLRDYLYIPLGGSRNGISGTVLAVMITMLLGGLWHGAAWTFVIWGALHGILIVIERLITIDRSPSIRFRWIRQLFIFHFIAFAWIFFRTPSFERAIKLFDSFGIPKDINFLLSSPIIPVLILSTILLHKFDTVQQVRILSERLPRSVLFPLSIMVILICAALSMNNPSAFIYFDF
jgi:D-alanyl-lipoteichoic acid acyltransferase DltB (MBOAT superfamily)